MKKLIFAIVALFTMTVSTQAMSYEQARDQALFLTDKMAYELNLTEEQYEAAYEVNLDYLMGVNTYDDVYGTYWTRRNLDLSYILLDWQYQAFVNATYFYRPLWWEGGYWHFGIYARYPHRDYLYYGHPHFYAEYRGGHSWHHNGGHSWYHGREFAGPGPQGGRQNGMRDGYQRGDYRNGATPGGNRGTYGNGQRPNPSRGNNANTPVQNPQPQNMGQGGNTRNFGGARNGNNRQSSTRTTATRQQQPTRQNPPAQQQFGGSRQGTTTQPRQSFTPNRSNTTPSRSGGSSFGGGRSGGNAGGGGGGSRSGGGSFGGHR